VPTIPTKTISKQAKVALNLLPALADERERTISGGRAWVLAVQKIGNDETITLRHYGTDIFATHREPGEKWDFCVVQPGAYSASDRDGINSLLACLGLPATAHLHNGIITLH
jgi:hypothetical protein